MLNIIKELMTIAPFLGHFLASATIPLQVKLADVIAEKLGISTEDMNQLDKVVANDKTLVTKIKAIEDELITKCVEHLL